MFFPVIAPKQGIRTDRDPCRDPAPDLAIIVAGDGAYRRAGNGFGPENPPKPPLSRDDLKRETGAGTNWRCCQSDANWSLVDALILKAAKG